MNDAGSAPLFAVVEESWFEVDGSLHVTRVLTRAALAIAGTAEPVGLPLRRLLAPLLSGDDLAELLEAATGDLATPRHMPAVPLATASGARVCDIHLHAARAGQVLVGFRDITDSVRQRAALQQAQSAAQLALAVLGADAGKLREYLQGASVTIALIKSLLQLPARDPAAFRQKLERILAEVLTLRAEAEALGLAAVADSARGFEVAVAAMALESQPTGDEFLPLAARLNDLFTHLTAATALTERRALSVTAAVAAPVRGGRPWHQRCEARLREFAQRLAGSDGHRAVLVLLGLDSVPESLQDAVDGMLTHLIGNACEHGIEAAEQRIATGKQAHGTITVQLSRQDDSLELSVQDDGQGFDTAKLGRAAVARGLISADALAGTPPRALIGLIFRPGFSTAPVSAPGRGLGMEFLRELVARLDGRINVATKSRQYTRFSISLPLSAGNSSAKRGRAA